MVVFYFILAGLMALFGVLGYLFGLGTAVLTLGAIGLGLFVIGSSGGRLVTLINRFYQFALAGGIQTMSGSGDLGQLRQKMNAVNPLIPSDAAGAIMLLILVTLIIAAILIGRHPRFRRPPSAFGLLIGLVNGYLVGAYLLDTMLPALAGTFPLPFGLGPAASAVKPAATQLPAFTATGGNLGAQLLQMIGGSSPASRALVVMIVVTAIVLTSLLVSVRGRGPRHSRTGNSRD